MSAVKPLQAKKPKKPKPLQPGTCVKCQKAPKKLMCNHGFDLCVECHSPTSKCLYKGVGTVITFAKLPETSETSSQSSSQTFSKASSQPLQQTQ